MNWHGYLLFDKPNALTMQQWRTVLVALYNVLNNDPDNPQPAKRLHYRVSLDNTKVILEANFNELDLDRNDLTRLPKYISDALDGAYTPSQVKTSLNNKVTRFNGIWSESGDLCREYISLNLSEWEEIV